MGLFNRFKKKAASPGTIENLRLENPPETLAFKLLFIEKPELNDRAILAEAKRYFTSINHSAINQSVEEIALLFAFPDYEVNLLDAIGPAQCIVSVNQIGELPIVAFQQSWNWPEAEETVKKCKYEIVVADVLSRTVPYKQRLTMVMDFLTALIKATNPDAVYSVPGQKISNPPILLNKYLGDEKHMLYGLCNVRLYNMSGGIENEILMDTIGLCAIGLPDFQIRLSGFDANQIAQLLWDYAYYIYERGDIIDNGNTLQGVTANTRWLCERQLSLIQPERLVLNVQVK